MRSRVTWSRKAQWAAFWTGYVASNLVWRIIDGNVFWSIFSAVLLPLFIAAWMFDRGADEEWPTVVESLRKRDE